MKRYIIERMQTKKRILYGVTKLDWGGASRYVFDLASAFSSRYRVTVMGGSSGMLSEKLDAIGISVIELSGLGRDMRWFGELRHLFQIIQTIRRYRPDILHLNSPKMAGLGAVAGRILGVPKIIVTIHGWSFAEDRNTVSKTLILFFSWLTAVFAHHVILINTKDYRAVLRFPFIPKMKFSLVHNGVAREPVKKREDARKELLDVLGTAANLISREKLWIGTVTELIENKDPETLVRAVSRLHTPLPCIIIGRGPKEKDLKTLTERLQVPHVAFAGFLPRAAQLLKAFDIFILSSTKEGLPYVLLEAGQAGIAVLATSIDGVRDIIENEKTGLLVSPKSPGNLARAIESLAANQELREHLGKNLQRKVAENFSFERMTRAIEAIYGDGNSPIA